MQIANGLTEADQKEGRHFEIADFHSQIKFLQVLSVLSFLVLYPNHLKTACHHILSILLL